MNKAKIIQALQNYSPDNTSEINFKQEILDFIHQNPEDYYKSSFQLGHLTGSAWIVSPDYQLVLLTHHRKLNKWLQPGGHTEEQDEDMQTTALREAQEETGLNEMELAQTEIFDLDIHLIPARGEMPAHPHLDFRYLIFASPNERLNITAESNDLRWFKLEEVVQLIDNESIMRMLDKTRRILNLDSRVY